MQPCLIIAAFHSENASKTLSQPFLSINTKYGPSFQWFPVLEDAWDPQAKK